MMLAAVVLVCLGVQVTFAVDYGAECVVAADSGNTSHPITGKVQFLQTDDGDTTIVIDLAGFITGDTYNTHGFHIHKNGSLTNGCVDAQGHYNPGGVDHAGPTDAIRHVGDLGNIMEDDSGNVAKTMTDDKVKLNGDTNVIGLSIVIHEKEDDLGKGGDDGSLTTGNAGSRLACCLIVEKEPSTIIIPTAEPESTTANPDGDNTGAGSQIIASLTVLLLSVIITIY